MHFTNSDVTNEGFLNNYLDSSSNNYLLTLNSRIEIITGLHPLDNQHLPNGVIAGWFGEEPENDHPIPWMITVMKTFRMILTPSQRLRSYPE